MKPRNFIFWSLPILLTFVCTAFGQGAPSSCKQCAEWNRPQRPFCIFGNSYYVGPHGLSSILITSDAGHILMDGALPESAPLIADNIRALGFRIEDVKIIVNTHVHYDHAGGIAELQRLSGARVLASKWTAAVMRNGGVGRGDPQYGSVTGIAPIKKVEELHDGQIVKVGAISVTPHLTAGHTPGGRAGPGDPAKVKSVTILFMRTALRRFRLKVFGSRTPARIRRYWMISRGALSFSR